MFWSTDTEFNAKGQLKGSHWYFLNIQNIYQYSIHSYILRNKRPGNKTLKQWLSCLGTKRRKCIFVNNFTLCNVVTTQCHNMNIDADSCKKIQPWVKLHFFNQIWLYCTLCLHVVLWIITCCCNFVYNAPCPGWSHYLVCLTCCIAS